MLTLCFYLFCACRYGARILITSFTRKAMGEAADEIFTIRLIDSVTVRGKSQSCKIYEVIDGDRFVHITILTFLC